MEPTTERHQVGDRVDDITLVDDTGAAVSLSELAAGGTLVVLLYRGHW